MTLIERVEILERRVAELERQVCAQAGWPTIPWPYHPMFTQSVGPREACKNGGVCNCVLNAPKIT